MPPCLAQLNDGAIVINYDRGECVDAAALDAAMASGKVRHAAIDADLFVNAETGAATGPMAPYLPLAEKYPGRLELLPHAAADTEHVSRVEGAKQAVDQIMNAIRYREVVNLKGDLPEGYSVGGAMTVAGVGKCSGQTIARALEADGAAEAARSEAEAMAAIWGALATADDGGAPPDADRAPWRGAGEELQHLCHADAASWASKAPMPEAAPSRRASPRRRGPSPAAHH